MAKRFPHLKDAPDAFGPGREVYEQIPGEFDQSRWADDVAHVRLTSVPWCGDYDNVVAFDSDETRDAWLDAREGYAFDSAWRRPPEGTYKVEVPYTTALIYNYLVIDYPTPTSEENPLPGTSTERFSRLCYFVTDARPSAGSTTELEIELDVWTTFMGRLDVSYLQLVQGHAPMTEVTPDAFLDDPLSNSTHLLVPDVGASEARVPASASTCVLDDETVTLVITTSRVDGSWGSKYGKTPAEPISRVGAPASPEAWIVSDLEAFLTAVTSQQPSFLQTVLAVASVPSQLVSAGDSATFCGRPVRLAVPRNVTLDLVDLSVSDFGYSEEYKGIAKLYTSPYAHLEIADETGSVTVVRVEDTTGRLDVRASLSLAWPYLSVDTNVVGMGLASSSLAWEVLGDAAANTLAGRWYDTLSRHDVPLFAVRESSETSYDWSSHWTNEQRRTAADNAYSSETASASTANANSIASNATARTNAANSASNITANNAVNVAANNELATRAQSAAAEGAQLTTDKLSVDTQQDINASSASYEAEQAGLAVAMSNNNAQATAGAASTIISGVAEVAASALSGDIGGAVGAAVSTIGAGAQQYVSWNAANASIAVSQSNSATIYNTTIATALTKSNAARNYTTQASALTQNTNIANVGTQNDAATSIAGNNASLINQNAENAKSTADGNANRTLTTSNDNAARTRDTALSAIANDTAQAALGNVVTHGEQRPGSSGVRPMMVQATVVTQAPGEIALAGDHMLRYGYACDFAWHVTNWCPCARFCFWRASDVWMSGAGNVAERYQQQLKSILLRGVTVWKDPNDIGSVSVYDNGF